MLRKQWQWLLFASHYSEYNHDGLTETMIDSLEGLFVQRRNKLDTERYVPEVRATSTSHGPQSRELRLATFQLSSSELEVVKAFISEDQTLSAPGTRRRGRNPFGPDEVLPATTTRCRDPRCPPNCRQLMDTLHGRNLRYHALTVTWQRHNTSDVYRRLSGVIRTRCRLPSGNLGSSQHASRRE